MAKKLNSMPDYRANMPRQPHDVSQSTAYTCCPGALNPVYFDMLHTGDELHFSASQFTRLNPMTTQALGEIDVHLDYFFVPLTVMYTPSASMFYQTDDLISSLVIKDELNKDEFPSCNLNLYFAGLSTHLNDAAHLFDFQDLPVNHFDCLGKSVCRMVDFLDLSLFGALHLMGTGDSQGATYPAITPWFALAYQAIYQLYFRNDDREPKNYHFNIDKYYDYSVIDLPFDKKSILEINYASRPKDYFNSVKVNPIGSAVSSLSASTLTSLYSEVNTWLSNTPVYPGEVDTSESEYGSSNARQSVSLPASGNLGSNQIRQLFMVDKLLRVVGRAEKNFESQFLAHYGIKIPHDVMHNITHIGHDMFTLNPEAIKSTANTYDPSTGKGSALGEIGGQCAGMLTGSKKHFTAPFHGVFMVISHIVPRRRYVLGLNKLHCLVSPNRFWQPEFDKKGMQPIFAYEVEFAGDDDITTTLGWQFAYEEFKRKSDRVMYAFKPTPSQRFAVNTYAPWVISSVPYGYLDNYSNNISNVHTYHALYASDLLVSPNDLNLNMIVPHNTLFPAKVGDEYVGWQIYQTDPFICDFNLNCKKVNMMSEYGEPEL